jgi:hypothetical protein
MKYPNELFKNCYWTFTETEYDNEDAFKEAFKTYHRSIGYKGKFPPIEWEKVCLEAPEMVLQYVIFPTTDEQEIQEPQVKLTAKNGKNFTPKELLFLMHSELKTILEDEDHHFFEGLTYSTDQDPTYPEIPVYFVDLGS